MNVLGQIFRKLKSFIFKLRRSPFPKSPNIHVSKDFIIGKYRNLFIGNHSTKITIKAKVHFKEFCNITVTNGAELTIKENVFFNNYTSLNCLEKIEIGENCQIGEGVKFYDHNHLFTTSPVIEVNKYEFSTAPIIVGKNCWLGSNVTILKGVNIGDNVIIGANNLIYKSIPSNTIIKAKVDYFIDNIER